MHQAKKGGQWYFDMKAHIGVDAQSGLVNHVHTTPANTADVTEVNHLRHCHETDVFLMLVMSAFKSVKSMKTAV